MSACHRVLGIVELVEFIIFDLPIKDILTVQRVSTTFRDSIKAAPRLQHALFNRTTAMSPDYHRCKALDDINPIFLSRSRTKSSRPTVNLPLKLHIYHDFYYFPGEIDRTACASFQNVQSTYLQDVQYQQGFLVRHVLTTSTAPGQSSATLRHDKRGHEKEVVHWSRRDYRGSHSEGAVGAGCEYAACGVSIRDGDDWGPGELELDCVWIRRKKVRVESGFWCEQREKMVKTPEFVWHRAS
ncbi:hypothetical protein CLAFUW4_12937 [Fulvia fulva]|uniref:F-box domain-containing protein n=1 Tax=Passalora fulva TaxID=5499 RepID=A0A9Q8PJ82_PASFU|nr:uncharacterized protein CLAFUR5_12802 [Fulvia fulva]KAK4611643.1 hypothetical protein CLAFUR4_12941 [Fulvia fulva]KAK4613213.1 hypothetical protein CLAFUR0_12947 [Fulvia fulva]UJO23422.1 hypothetical protein CLAFUR5_12802 [Fulvia fulva]WPV21061.1 hypothetical protein CLAFUW4_12937 [Fulvia fulva]WPV35865.1 hypothetical protein CLAFUW7_12944 [Fulvia fulva]